MKQIKKVSAWLFMLALLTGVSSCKEDSSDDMSSTYKVIRPLFYVLSGTPDPDIGELELTWRWKQDPDQIERASSYTLQLSTKSNADEATFLSGMVHNGQDMTSQWSVELDPSTLSHTFFNLQPNTKYFARIKAHDRNNAELDSPWCYSKAKTTAEYTGEIKFYLGESMDEFPDPYELEYDDLDPIVVKISTARDEFVVTMPVGSDWLEYTVDYETKKMTLTPKGTNSADNPVREATVTVSVDEGFKTASVKLLQKKMQWRLTSSSTGMQFDETGAIFEGAATSNITTDCPTGWSATVEAVNPGDDVSWCHPTASGATGESTLTVTADANAGVDPRSARVVITAGMGSVAAQQSFIVNQFGGGLPYFDIPDFSGSSVYKVMNGTTQVGEICREYLRSGDGGATIDAQAIVIYPMLSSGKADLTKGVVLQVNVRNGSAGSYTYVPDPSNIHGGSVSFDKATNKITSYTAGTATAETTVIVNKNGSFSLRTTELLASSTPYTTEPNLFVDVRGTETISYKMVKIATQYWMAENLRTFKYKDGTDLPLKWSSNGGATKPATPLYANATEYASSSNTNGVFIMNNNANDELTTYGVMYNAFVSGMVSGGINGDHWTGTPLASDGWKVGDRAEWQAMYDYLGTDAGAIGLSVKAKSPLWASAGAGSDNGNDITGFSILPSGMMTNAGVFQNVGLATQFWISQHTASTSSNRAQLGNATGNNNWNIGTSGANGASAGYLRLMRVDE